MNEFLVTAQVVNSDNVKNNYNIISVRKDYDLVEVLKKSIKLITELENCEVSQIKKISISLT